VPGLLPHGEQRRAAGHGAAAGGGLTDDAACAGNKHFHADHYGGLHRRFDKGLIYCTPVTARLVHQELKVAWERLRPVALNTPTCIRGVRVTFLEAHHCPGAAMILFEPAGEVPTLHQGDCRCCPAMRAEPALAALRGRVTLVADTTYADPKYHFPTQEQVRPSSSPSSS